jgi:hypothetical protein
MATALPIWDRAWRQASMKMGGDPPKWVQIFPYPTYDCTIDGKRKTLITDEVSQRSIVDVFDEKGNAAPIDYEHATTTPGVFYAPAAGRIPKLVAGGKLGLLGMCEWNESGTSNVAGGLYYVDSPTFYWSPEDNRIYVFVSLALTNLPGSYNRPYITDHNDINYEALLNRTAAKSGALTTRHRPLRLKCAKGGAPVATDNSNTTGNKTLSDNVLSNIRYAFDMPLTTTSNELRAMLQTMIDLVPANDDPIFMIDDDQKQKGVKNVAQILGFVQQKDVDHKSAIAAALKPVRVAAGVTDENADGNAIALSIIQMKANSAPIERVRELEKQLAEAQEKSSTDDLTIILKQNEAKMTPANVAEAKRLAEQSMDLAKAFITALPPLDLASQSTGTAPKKPQELPHTPAGGGTNGLLAESQTAEKRTREIMKEKNCSYAQASSYRLEEESAAQK